VHIRRTTEVPVRASAPFERGNDRFLAADALVSVATSDVWNGPHAKLRRSREIGNGPLLFMSLIGDEERDDGLACARGEFDAVISACQWRKG